MLVITRKIGEKIVIGDEIILSILGIKNNQIRLGIDAPREVTVYRDEIYRRIQAENQSTEELL